MHVRVNFFALLHNCSMLNVIFQNEIGSLTSISENFHTQHARALRQSKTSQLMNNGLHTVSFFLYDMTSINDTTQFHFGTWQLACCNCAIMQRSWPAHASPGNILKNHPKEDDLQTLIGKKWAEIIDDVILHSFGAKFSHSNNCKKKNVCFHEMVEEIKVPLFFLSLILLIWTQVRSDCH